MDQRPTIHWKFLRAVYDFGMERGHVSLNPARAVAAPVYRSQGGAAPWTGDGLTGSREEHPRGTTEHLALSLFMFTACRIGDAHQLGRHNARREGGILWLHWTPGKKGSHAVSSPVLPPLTAAIEAQKIVGPAYLLTEYGQPFDSPEELRNPLAKWCAAAGLKGRSSHGIRKAVGHLMAIHGATQYEIMAVHGHVNAATSEVYTRDVERRRLRQMAVSKLAGLDW